MDSLLLNELMRTGIFLYMLGEGISGLIVANSVCGISNKTRNSGLRNVHQKMVSYPDLIFDMFLALSEDLEKLWKPWKQAQL